MSSINLALLRQRRFGPFFIVQFLGAFNDNIMRFAMLFLASFILFRGHPEKAAQLGVIATGLFMLPFFLFSSLAGQLADSIDKANLIRWIKGAEVVIMLIGIAGFALQSIPILLFVLFLMGSHSTLFGPVKYAIMPQHLTHHEILNGTGLIEAGTFIAILAGQLTAGVVLPWHAGLIATALAALGFLAACMIPKAPPQPDAPTIEINLVMSTWHVMRMAWGSRALWLAIFGTSWFFAAGAVLLSALGPLVSDVIHAGQSVATFFLLVFSISIAVGALFIGWLLKGLTSPRTVPTSALLMTLGFFALWVSTNHFVTEPLNGGVADYLHTPGSLLILLALVMIAFAGGTFIVPLYAVLQTESHASERAQIIAANNIINALVTVILVIATSALLRAGLTVPQLMGALGLATLGVTVHMRDIAGTVSQAA